MFIPDQNFFLPDPGSRVKRHRIRICNKEFLTKKFVTKLLEMIRDV
jgi:hypothetical protein